MAAVLTPVLVSIVLATAALAGCGGGDDAAEADGTTTSEQGAEASLPEPIGAGGAERTRVEDRVLAQIEIPNGPDWMVEAFGSLWVKRDDGVVVRVDPDTGKTIAEIRPPKAPSQDLCQGIGASAKAVWSCAPGGTLVRIDPSTDEVSATAKVDKLPDQGRIVSAAGRVWVLTDSGAALTPIDDEGRPGKALRLGTRCTDLAADGASLWAMCPIDGRVLHIDGEAAEVTATADLPGATNASVAGELWVGFEDGLAQLDRETLEVLAVYDVSPSYGGSIFAAANAVWVREEGGAFLSRIDPQAGRIAETVAAPRLPSGGDVVQIGDSVWATAYDDGTLVELTAR